MNLRGEMYPLVGYIKLNNIYFILTQESVEHVVELARSEGAETSNSLPDTIRHSLETKKVAYIHRTSDLRTFTWCNPEDECTDRCDKVKTCKGYREWFKYEHSG